jgi:hypothetical protein
VSSVKQRHEEEEDEIMRTTRAWDSTLEKRSRAPVVGRASVLTIQKQKMLREKASGCRRSHPWDPANQHIDFLITLLLLAQRAQVRFIGNWFGLCIHLGPIFRLRRRDLFGLSIH